MVDGYVIDMNRRLFEVAEDKDHVKVLEPELNSFQMDNLDFGERDDGEWEFREVDQTVGGG